MDVKRIAVRAAKKSNTHNPFSIAEQHGIQIITCPLHAVLGYYTRYKRVQCIILQDGLPEELYRFVCAHELGHALMHATLNTQWLRRNTFISTDKLEREASTFAVELLLPDDMVRE